MNVSAWSIRNPIAVIVLFLVLTVSGLLAFHFMRIQNNPDMDLPVVTVTASLGGAAPEQLENDVARKIEDAVGNVQGIRHITTTISDGVASLSIEFRLEKPLQEALDEVQSAVQGIRSDLPTELPDPIVAKVDLASMPVIGFSVQADHMDAEALSWFVDNELKKKLLAIPGVGKVTRVGGVTRQVHVDLNPEKLRSIGMTASEVSSALKSQDIESSGGVSELGSAKQSVRIIANARTADEVGRLEVPLPNGGHVYLHGIAEIRDSYEDPTTSAWQDGKQVIGFEVSRSKFASEIEVGKAVRTAVRQLEAEKQGLKFTESMDFVGYVEEQYDASMRILYEGALLAVIVVWLFLRDWRATIVAAVALPMSILPAFVGMYLFGFTLNTVTLLALSLVVGVLVDDAIVEVENIMRHLRMGKSPYQAAMEATQEIGLAVVATTFALIAVFLPTAFMSGIIGQYFRQFGWTAVLAVFASLVVARMLTPMMAAYMLKPILASDREPRWMRGYMHGVEWVMKHRRQTVVYAVLFFVLSIALVLQLKTAFVPPDDNDQTQVTLTLPPGTPIASTERAAEKVRQKLMSIEHIERVYTTVGASSLTGADEKAVAVDQATLIIRMRPRGERPVKQEVESEIRQALAEVPGVRFSIGLGDAGNRYTVGLTGNDNELLKVFARRVETELRTLSGLGTITSSADLEEPELIVRLNEAHAAELGVTAEKIASELRIATQGDYEQNLPKMNLDNRQIPIVIKLDRQDRYDIEKLKRITVKGNKGSVMIGEVASLQIGSGPSVISRFDKNRNINIDIGLAEKNLGEVDEDVSRLSELQKLPSGIEITPMGDAEMMQEMFSGFLLAMGFGILSIYVVLVLLFQGFLHPITILSALPLSIGGAFVGLLTFNHDISLSALIGLVMLMGIVTKNSILLVEYAIVARRDQGMSRWEALWDACHKRARPIIMTSLAMGAGMIPIIAGSASTDSSFRSPMGVAVFGGLLTSTALSLLVVPAVFTYVDDFRLWILRKVQKDDSKQRDVQ